MLKNQVPINTIQITQKAASKVKQFADEKSMSKFGLKVSVKGGGCSGLTYVLDIVEGYDEEDKIIKSSGIEVYIPKKAFVFLAGTVLDFSDGLNGKGFEFTNPNAKKTCGCGTSFSV
ncbi:MAG: iron-sulfur cluster assembly accessory protein [Chloroflexi bacterium]|nr:iron-sulfur cluster assembly accessory protein [Chloroflexota bacterium]MAR34689.1 iron-sulfur cluster assembly accessory protein [Chloroflexota bacterium]|tara:strand:+ start:9349 stop:9699 length:351 start_codon:yes stop_codon:yes gene_type:complete